MAEQIRIPIPAQTVGLDDVKWAALNRRYEEPVPSMEAVSQAVEYVLDYLTDPERQRNEGPWCSVCLDKGGGPGLLDPCRECGRYPDIEQP